MTAYTIPTAAGLSISALGGDIRSYTEVVDFATQTNAAADTFDILNIPAGSVVLGGTLEVLTADAAGNSGTLALSVAGTDLVAASTVASAVFETSVDVAPLPQKAATMARLTVATGEIDAKVRVTIIMGSAGNITYHADGNNPQTVTLT